MNVSGIIAGACLVSLAACSGGDDKASLAETAQANMGGACVGMDLAGKFGLVDGAISESVTTVASFSGLCGGEDS